MPEFFSTGNQTWDQGLNRFTGGLAGLFDPSKQAQAGLAGAQTAKVLTETERERFQNQKLYSLPTTLSQIVGVGTDGSGGVPPPAQGQPGPVGQPMPAPVQGQPVPPPVQGQDRIPPIAGNPATPPNLMPPQPGQAGSGTNVPPAQAPSIGTDGKPMPPDPSLGSVFHPGTLQPPGGGVKYAPPAGPNGSPARTLDFTPYITQLAQSGLPAADQARMAGAMLAGLVQSGRIDNSTANRIMSQFGNNAGYETDQATVRTGMNNATTLRTTQMTNENAVRLKGMDPREVYDPNDPLHPKIRPLSDVIAPGAQFSAPNVKSAEDDRTPMTVIAPDGKTLIPTTKGEYLKNPAMGRPATPDDMKPTVVQPQAQPGQPPPPPAMTTTGQATTQGSQPHDEALARRDAETVSIVTPDGQVVTSTRGDLRAHPTIGREYNPQVDGALVQSVDQTTGKTIFTLARKAPGQEVAPQTTDQRQAQDARRVGNLTETNPEAAPGAAAGVQAGNVAITPKTNLQPDQEIRMNQIIDEEAKRMYPPPSGTHPGTSDAPAELAPEHKAEVVRRVRELALSDPRYKNDPAAAIPQVMQQMQAEGTLPKDVDRSKNWVTGYGKNISGSGTKARVIVRGPTLANTVAPKSDQPTAAGKTAPTRLPPGAIGVAPPGAVEGQTGTFNGQRGKIVGGFIMSTQ